jgi:hypothetical protein
MGPYLLIGFLCTCFKPWSKMTPNKALQSDKIAGYAANFAAEREALCGTQSAGR